MEEKSSTRTQIAALAGRGLGTAEVARHLDLSSNTVRYHLERLAAEGSGAAGDAVEHGETDLAIKASVSQVRTRAAVSELLEQGHSRAEVARRLDLSKATVSYHARRLGASIDERCARRYDWTTVQRYYDAGRSVSECAAAFGFSKQTWHAAVNRGKVIPRAAAMPLAELCRADTPRSRVHLKRRLISEGIKSPRCERCGLDRWLGARLVVELHHRNGERHDNRIENLALLCPNCHSQTPNFGGRSRTRLTRPQDAVLESLEGLPSG